MHLDINAIAEWPSLPELGPNDLENLAILLRSAAWKSSYPQFGADLRSQAEMALTLHLGIPNVLITSSGLHALSVALRTLGMKARDVVAVPAGTWSGISQLVESLEGEIIYYEISSIGSCITFPQTDGHEVRFVLAVHTHARASNLPLISSQFPNATLIEDSAHCPGFRNNDRQLNTMRPAASIVSFEATKPLTCLEGGAVSFDDVVDLQRAVAIVDQDALRLWNNRHPEDRRPPISTCSSALLISQIERYRSICDRRAHGALFFLELLKSREINHWAHSSVVATGSFYGIMVCSPSGEPDGAIKRIQYQANLICDRHYRPYPAWTAASGELPNAESEHLHGIVVPHHAFLADPAAIERIVEGIT